MRNWNLMRVFLAGALCLGGCATLPPELKVARFGTVDVSEERNLVEKAEQVQDTREVIAAAGRVPEGLQLMEQGSKIAVLSGYESRYEIVGSVDASYPIGTMGTNARNMFWVWDYKETWRKWLCYPQVPLKIASLSIWNIVPLAWPCIAKIPGDETDRKEHLIEESKRGVKALGANLFIVSGTGGLQVTTVNQYGAALNVQQIGTTQLGGFAVKQAQ